MFVSGRRTGRWPLAAILIGMMVVTGCGSGGSEGGASKEEEKTAKAAGKDAKKPAGFPMKIAAQPAGTSQPLPSVLLNRISLVDEETSFGESIVGRKLSDIDAYAVEMVAFGMMSDTTSRWTMAQMESLRTAGVLSDDTKTFALFSRAIVHGDAASVESALNSGTVQWQEAMRRERYPLNGIRGKLVEKAATR